MNRREILTASAAAAALEAAGLARADESASPQAPGREYYELRRYGVRIGPQSRITTEYFRDALVPALNRQDIGPVGMFSATIGSSGAFYVLMPARNVEALAVVEARLGGDARYNEAGAPFLTAPAAQPAFERIDSSLLVAFTGWPRLVVPAATLQHKNRVFELRTYESPSDRDYRRKLEMFNSGEYTAFQRAGFWQVFFGEVLVGARRPCLTYMLGFRDLGQREALWRAFFSSPEWKQLTGDKRFSFEDIVSSVNNSILTPLECSQI